MDPGSYLSFDTWDSAEPRNGQTVEWLKSTSGRLHIWLGAGFFEADGEDFYDTFLLTTPEGKEAGRVRKQAPAEAEAYFFRGYAGPHVIDTAIGKIGVGICAENYYCLFVDTAESYPAEEVVGQAVRGTRDRNFIATKVCARSGLASSNRQGASQTRVPITPAQRK